MTPRLEQIRQQAERNARFLVRRDPVAEWSLAPSWEATNSDCIYLLALADSLQREVAALRELAAIEHLNIAQGDCLDRADAIRAEREGL